MNDCGNHGNMDKGSRRVVFCNSNLETNKGGMGGGGLKGLLIMIIMTQCVCVGFILIPAPCDYDRADHFLGFRPGVAPLRLCQS